MIYEPGKAYKETEHYQLLIADFESQLHDLEAECLALDLNFEQDKMYQSLRHKIVKEWEMSLYDSMIQYERLKQDWTQNQQRIMIGNNT